MIRFECDYSEGAHPEIMDKLCKTNLEQTCGYGTDEYCEAARSLIRKQCVCPDAQVHFLVGGTQANATVISAILRPYQGVLCAVTGHINAHESGAIEAGGHKVLTLPSDDGKITAQQVQQAYDAHWGDVTHEHIVQPGMVYISHPTENGVLYSKSELTVLSRTCGQLGLPLYMDGARLGYALGSPGNDLTLADIARLCDVFYIGGTKVGALFGEAVVIPRQELIPNFRYMIKQHGGMMAKGRLLGLQFQVLFETGLYQQLGKMAVEQAIRMRGAFLQRGVQMRYASYTNQQFPMLPKTALDTLGQKYSFSPWGMTTDGLNVVRFCTSWATKDEDVNALIEDIQHMKL